MSLLAQCPPWLLVGFGIGIGLFPERLLSILQRLRGRSSEKP